MNPKPKHAKKCRNHKMRVKRSPKYSHTVQNYHSVPLCFARYPFSFTVTNPYLTSSWSWSWKNTLSYNAMNGFLTPNHKTMEDVCTVSLINKLRENTFELLLRITNHLFQNGQPFRSCILGQVLSVHNMERMNTVIEQICKTCHFLPQDYRRLLR